MNRSKLMELELAKVGIVLDPPKAIAAMPPRCDPRPEIDRAQLRAILLERGARDGDLDWLTKSCPDLASALSYVPRAR